MKSLDKLCIHTITTKPWSLEMTLDKYCEYGVKGISVWQNVVEKGNPEKIGERIASYPIEVVSYVRGGFFAHNAATERSLAIEKNKKLIRNAAAIGAPMLVLVCGADPLQSLEESRSQIFSSIEKILPSAIDYGVKLGIEPLHPMYADTRSAINTIAEANELASEFQSEYVGVVADAYHLWWDPQLKSGLSNCAQNGNLLAYHICDWRIPTEDLLNDREIMGRGCIPLKQINSWIVEAGFEGFFEVEIFSHRYWQMDQEEFLKLIVDAYQKMQFENEGTN